ncbi:MAG: hypothetical protein HYU97_00610 [Deltaproteobacteria bacterium]|nr:hypothetical protein [Deltaproteobacteria bacterium]
MEFVGIKELSQNTSKYVNIHDWVIVTKNGKPVKLILDIEGEELEDLILAKHFDLETLAEKTKKEYHKEKTSTFETYLQRRK